MQYVGIHTQQVRNNMKSMLLLFLFPCILFGMEWAFLVFVNLQQVTDEYGFTHYTYDKVPAVGSFMIAVPVTIVFVIVWSIVFFYKNDSIVSDLTGSVPLKRKDNPRVYNIVENLTMTCGMPMPKINIIEDEELNAFASGINEKSYTVTLTSGLCDVLDDDELAGVIGHELTHIRNKDTRLVIISIIFVGIMSTLLVWLINILWRGFFHSLSSGSQSRYRSRSGEERDRGNNVVSFLIVMAVAIALASIAYFLTLLTRFAISRKREYMADAGGAELCGNPLALASALRKISEKTALGYIEREDISQLYIVRPKFIGNVFTNFMANLFSTHPSIESRIAYLEQF